MSDTEPVDETRLGTLVWDPTSMPADGVTNYLERSGAISLAFPDFPFPFPLVS